jgi:hypothetical protein
MYLITEVLLQGRLIKRKRIYVFITAIGAIAKREGRAIIKKITFYLGIMCHQHVRYLHEFPFKGPDSRNGKMSSILFSCFSFTLNQNIFNMFVSFLKKFFHWHSVHDAENVRNGKIVPEKMLSLEDDNIFQAEENFPGFLQTLTSFAWKVAGLAWAWQETHMYEETGDPA